MKGLLQDYKQLGDSVDKQLPGYIMRRSCLDQLSADASEGDQAHLKKLQSALEERSIQLHKDAQERDKIHKTLDKCQDELKETIEDLMTIRYLVENVIVPPSHPLDDKTKVVPYNEAPFECEIIESQSHSSLMCQSSLIGQLNNIAFIAAAILLIPLMLRLFRTYKLVKKN